MMGDEVGIGAVAATSQVVGYNLTAAVRGTWKTERVVFNISKLAIVILDTISMKTS